jgi:hypothetical protein
MGRRSVLSAERLFYAKITTQRPAMRFGGEQKNAYVCSSHIIGTVHIHNNFSKATMED